MPNQTHLNLARLAVRLIKSHGRDLVLIREINHVGDKWDPEPEPEEVTIRGVSTSVGGGLNQFERMEVDGVKTTQRKFIVDSKVEPLLDMRVRDEGLELSIKAVTKIAPGDTGIIYKIYLAT